MIKTPLRATTRLKVKSLKSKGIKPSRVLRAKPQRRIKPKGINKLQKEADILFSRWLRYRNLDEDGMQTCFTCGWKGLPKAIQAGHFVSRYYKVVRYDENNVRNQCFVCNIQKKGDYVTFREKLIEQIGEYKVLAIEAARKREFKASIEFYQRIITKYGS